VSVRLGAAGIVGALGGGMRAHVVLDAHRLDTMEGLPLMVGMTFGLDLGFALAVGGFGFLENVYKVFAL
jgi:hypothetical protein